MMTRKNAQNRGFTLAEMMITLAVMGIVLALVATFSSTASRATRQRTQAADTLSEIEKVNELITDWFYAFDDTDYTVLKVQNKPDVYKYNYVEGTAINVSPSEFTIRNKKFNSMIADGIVPTNYQLIYNVDDSLNKVITAVYSVKHEDDRSVKLDYITNIDFDYDIDLDLLKCTYTYNDIENENLTYTYTLVLSRHTSSK